MMKQYNRWLGHLLVCMSFMLQGSAVDEFETAIKGKTGKLTQQEIDAAKNVAEMNWDADRIVLRDKDAFKKLVGLIMASSFYSRDGAKNVLELLFEGPIFAGENAIHVAGALDVVLDFLLDRIEKGSGPQAQEALGLLNKLDISFVGIGGMMKGSNMIVQHNPNFKPIERLVALAQAKNSKPLFDKARAYFAQWGNYQDYALTIVKEMAERPLSKEAVDFAWYLINNFLDMSVVPEGELKEAVKKKYPTAFMRTVEKAMQELEDLVAESATKRNDGLVLAHARKVAQFPLDAVKKSPEAKTLNKRTLQVLATLLASERPEAAEVVDILLGSKTISDINEKVMVNGELKQLLPLYILHVVEKPGEKTEKEAADIGGNLLTMVERFKADTMAPVEVQGKTKPIYLYLAENTVKNKAFIGEAMFAAFRRFSPAGVKEYGEKESGFTLNQDVANAMLKTLVTAAIKNPEEVKGTTIPEKLAHMIDNGADHRLIPIGPVRERVKKALGKPGVYEKGVAFLGKKDSTIPTNPTRKETMKETIEALKADLQNGKVEEAQELAGDLKFLAAGAQAEGKQEEKLDEPLKELFEVSSLSKVLTQAPELVKTLEDVGAITTGKVQLEEQAKKLEEMVQSVQKGEVVVSEPALRQLTVALKALI